MACTFEVWINGRLTGLFSSLENTYPVIDRAFSECSHECALTWSVVFYPHRDPRTANFAVHTMTRETWKSSAGDTRAYVAWMELHGWNDSIDDPDDDE